MSILPQMWRQPLIEALKTITWSFAVQAMVDLNQTTLNMSTIQICCLLDTQATKDIVGKRLQCVAFDCRARHPFHPQKLYNFAVKNFLLQETELYKHVDAQEKDKGLQVSANICFAPAVAHLLACFALIRSS